MDILMIYWNSVWSNSRRDTSNLLASHSGAELEAYERRLHPRKALASKSNVVHIDGRPWTADTARPIPTPH
jgi:hypothetical protein